MKLTASCGQDASDSSGLRCALCKSCLHLEVTIEGSRATCEDCGKTFIGW